MALVTVGFNQIGTSSTWYDPDNEETTQLYFDGHFPLKQYTLAKDITGLCSVFYYKYFDNFGQGWGIPCLFSDNNNRPHEKISVNESYMDLYCASLAQAGWVTGSFNVKRTIPAGSKVWFGMYSPFLCPRYSSGGGSLWTVDFVNDAPPEYAGTAWEHDIGNVQLSLYFTYDDMPPGVLYTRSIGTGMGMSENCTARRVVRKALFQIAYFADSVHRLLILQKLLYSAGSFSDSLLYGFLKVYKVVSIAGIRALLFAAGY